MSQEEPSSRKERKAARDVERHKKGKKRKHADTEVQDVPAADETTEEGAVAEHVKKSKKRKAEDSLEDGEATTGNTDTAVVASAKPKKRKKPRTEKTEGEDTTHPAKSRFIVFVGNLPYKTTDDSLKAHFKKLQPFTLRHRTDPQTKRSKGFAFLEFENYDRMKTCLKLYHHSMFDPENVKEDGADLEAGKEQTDESNRKKKKSQARRINVELTAGGGGKTDARKEKIKAKNERLEEQRKRRAEEEGKEKAKKARKEQKEGAKGKAGKRDVQEEPATAGAADASHGIHPSRLARMSG